MHGIAQKAKTWLDGPSEGLLKIGREQGFLPPFFQKVNARGIEVRILAAQGAVITVIALLIYVAPLIFLFIAAAIMRTARGSGLIITGSVMAFVLAFELLIMTCVFAFGMLVTLNDPWPRDKGPVALTTTLVFITSLAGLVISIIAGVRALMALSRSAPSRRQDYYY